MSEFSKYILTVDKNQYALMLMCIYGMKSQYEKNLERIVDKRETLGLVKRIFELDELKEALIGGETE